MTMSGLLSALIHYVKQTRKNIILSHVDRTISSQAAFISRGHDTPLREPTLPNFFVPSNSSLYPWITRTRLRAFAYFPCTRRSIHSSTQVSQRPSGDLLRHTVKCLQVYKSHVVSCWQLDTSIAAAWLQSLRLLCLYLGRSQTGNRRLIPTVL